MSTASFAARVAKVRRFNRFYTKRIGLLERHLLDDGLSLTEVRVLFELAQQKEMTATHLVQILDLDPGYLSRLLRGLHRSGLIDKQRSENDGRQWQVSLSDKGRRVFASLEQKAEDKIGHLLRPLSDEQQQALVEAMQQIGALLDDTEAKSAPIVLRPHCVGDIGYLTYRHGVIYAEEWGFDETFEALVADILAQFVHNYEPAKERLWIAERAGDILGSVAIMQDSDRVARLRVLLVEPRARGCGLGRMLMDECLRFARRTGYEKIVLSTVSSLTAARHLYEAAGFRCTNNQPVHRWGQDMVDETWELMLD